MDVYNLTQLPEGEIEMASVVGRKANGLLNFTEGPDVLKWSGRGDIPAIGNTVNIGHSEFTTGTVTGYFIECGYVGCYIKLDDQPDWHKRQCGKGQPTMLFGAEFNRELP